jgi:chemotaxis protein CheD
MATAPEFTLQPGEAKLVRGPAILKTVLGSCAGVTFRVERLGLGAMCHPMLPTKHAYHESQVGGPRRYVDHSLCEMIRRIEGLGARREEIEVKLFGCCDVLNFDESRVTVGSMNAQMVLKVLSEEGVRLAVHQIGGPVGVCIYFVTDTGEVFLRRLAPLHNSSRRGQ